VLRSGGNGSLPITTYEPHTLLSIRQWLCSRTCHSTSKLTRYGSLRLTSALAQVFLSHFLKAKQYLSLSVTLLQYFIESNSYFGLVIYWCSTMLELDIIIVGAGISGLASAIALSRAGHNVQVSAAGSQIGPNN